ncbi:NADPH:quinone oxidoreductase family protein [Rhodopseudomonas sp. B29]|uniref:NADPH:quinone oxidoreductase family protein n=1 Tax=Rhodopseudomonas sp. B29 TaxID=95607 RepID=UPI00034C8308|nr:NADPH:quinone oxidoreductase family protein [Rhodopseudomonas sp. B29]
MRALMSDEPGGPETLQLLDVPEPVAAAGQILIAVKACGVNYPDLLMIQDLYQVKAPRPFAPGAEIAGVVTALGPDVTQFSVGDRVAARIGTGGMAEAVAVDVSRCAPIPDGMSFVDAAVTQFTFETALYALRNRAAVKPGETVLVLGAGGGVGIAAVQVGRNMGARVIAAASSEDKLAFARKHGAADGVLYPPSAPADRKAVSRQFKAALGAGADVVIDPVGGWLTDVAIRCVADGGRYVVLGFTAGIPSLPLNLPLLKNCDVLGVNWRAFTLTQAEAVHDNKRELMRWFAEGRLSSGITAEYALADGARAIQQLANRSAVGKIVVII